MRSINHSVTLGFLSSDYCPRQVDFKFVVALNAFTTVQCTEADIVRLETLSATQTM